MNTNYTTSCEGGSRVGFSRKLYPFVKLCHGYFWLTTRILCSVYSLRGGVRVRGREDRFDAVDTNGLQPPAAIPRS